MKRGTIVLTQFPFTDLSQNKVRPALVVSIEKEKSNEIIVAYISSVLDSGNPDNSVQINSNESYFSETGLKVSSVIRVDKLATIDKKIILGELGSLNDKVLNIVNEKLKIFLGLI